MVVTQANPSSVPSKRGGAGPKLFSNISNPWREILVDKYPSAFKFVSVFEDLHFVSKINQLKYYWSDPALST